MAAKDWPPEEQAIRDNLGFVYWVVDRHPARRFHSRDDLVAAGMEGLLRGIRTFDPDRGAFAPHVHLQIKQAIHHHLRTVDGDIRNANIRARRAAVHVSFEDIVHGRARHELLPDDTESVEELAIECDLTPSHKVLAGLTGRDTRQRRAFDLLAAGWTKVAVANAVGVSPTRVRQWTQQWAHSEELRRTLLVA